MKIKTLFKAEDFQGKFTVKNLSSVFFRSQLQANYKKAQKYSLFQYKNVVDYKVLDFFSA